MRNSFLNVAVVLVLLGLSLAGQGCAPVVAHLSDPVVRQGLLDDVYDGVQTGLLLVSDEDRPREAERIIRVATAIRTVAENDITAGDVRSLLTELALARVDPEDRPRLRIVINLVFRRLKRFGIDPTIVPQEHFVFTRQLVIDLANEAIKSASEVVGP